MSNLSTFYPAPITAADLGLGAGSNATFGSIQNTPIGNTTPSTGAFTTLNATNGTITASAPVLDLSQTWNNAAVTFTGLRFNVTNTASAVASLLADFQVGGFSIFQLRRDGQFLGPAGAMVVGTTGGGRIEMWGSGFGGQPIVFRSSNATYRFALDNSSSGSNGTFAVVEANNTLSLLNGVNSQTFRIYNTFTDASNYERAKIAWSSNVLQIGTEKGGTGSARALEFQTDGVTRMGLSTAGVFTLNTTNTLTITPNSSSALVGGAACVTIDAVRLALSTSGSDRLSFSAGGDAWFASATIINFSGRTRFSSPADGQLVFQNGAGTDFNRLQFGGTTSSFPALKRSSTTLQVRLADDSAFAPLASGDLTLGDGVATQNSALTLFGNANNRYAYLKQEANSGLVYEQNATASNSILFSGSGVTVKQTGRYGWGGSNATNTGDLFLWRDAAGVLAQYNGINAQAYRLYNTWSSTTSFERLNIRWATNECVIDAEAGSGGGTLRGIKIGSATSSLLGFYGVTPVDQPATVADPAGGGTVDTEARTAINAIIDRLQELGLIA